MRWLMPRLRQFKARHPDMDIRLCAPDSPVEFPRDDIAVSIRAGRSDWPEDIVQAAVSGFEVAIGPHPLVADDVAAGRLVAPFGFVPNGLSMYVSYPKARATDPQVVAFRDWLLEVGRASPHADGLE